MGQIEDLEAQVERLEIELAELRSRQLPDSFAIDTVRLTEQEQGVLRLIGAGLKDREAMQKAGVSNTFVDRHFQNSVYFAKAYSDLKEAYNEWLEAQLRFVLPTAWAEIMKIITTDTDALREQDSGYARTMLQTKAKFLAQLIKTHYGEETRLTLDARGTEPALQVAQQNAQMIAEYTARLLRQKESGDLEKLLPENQIVDVLPVDFKPVFATQPRNDEGLYKCLVCDEHVEHLSTHALTHDLTMDQYKHRFDLDPLVDYD
jgi:hypothetical protein